MFKKNFKLVLFLLMGLYVVHFMAVNAETELPYTGSAGGVNYTIEEFEVRIYDSKAFTSNILAIGGPIKTVQIPAGEITINPTEDIIASTEQTSSFPNIIGVKLNFSSEKEIFEKYIKTTY